MNESGTLEKFSSIFDRKELDARQRSSSKKIVKDLETPQRKSESRNLNEFLVRNKSTPSISVITPYSNKDGMLKALHNVESTIVKKAHMELSRQKILDNLSQTKYH